MVRWTVVDPFAAPALGSDEDASADAVGEVVGVPVELVAPVGLVDDWGADVGERSAGDDGPVVEQPTVSAAVITTAASPMRRPVITRIDRPMPPA